MEVAVSEKGVHPTTGATAAFAICAPTVTIDVSGQREKSVAL